MTTIGNEGTISPLIKGAVNDILGGEEVIIEAARELIREEIKKYMMSRLNENPELKKEMKDAIGMFFEAKVSEALAGIRIAKASAKFGVELMPEYQRKMLSEEVESELETIIEKILK